MKTEKKTTRKKSVKAKTESTSMSDEKVFDVARPGESIPSSSGRPLIISHKPGISHDPMVSSPDPDEGQETKVVDTNTETTETETVTAEKIMKAPKKNRIEPLTTSIVVENDAAPEEPDTSATESSESAQSVDETVHENEADDISNEIEDVSSTVTTKKQTQDEEAKKQAQELEKQAEIEKLIENKHFFVPINAAQKRRSRRAIVVLGLLLVVLVVALVVLDAEIASIGVEPLTDFL